MWHRLWLDDLLLQDKGRGYRTWWSTLEREWLSRGKSLLIKRCQTHTEMRQSGIDIRPRVKILSVDKRIYTLPQPYIDLWDTQKAESQAETPGLITSSFCPIDVLTKWNRMVRAVIIIAMNWCCHEQSGLFEQPDYMQLDSNSSDETLAVLARHSENALSII